MHITLITHTPVEKVLGSSMSVSVHAMRRCTYVGALHAAARPPHAQRYSYLRGDVDVDVDDMGIEC